MFLFASGYMRYLATLLIVLCDIISLGGELFYVCHMMYESGNNEVGTAGAIVVLISIANIVVIMFFTLFTGSQLIQTIILAVFVLLAICVNRNGLPTGNPDKYGGVIYN